MAGLPKKYAKMGFKKGWREYRKVHKKRKGGSKRKTTRRKSPKKRTYKRRSNPGGKVTKKKFTQGDMNITAAGTGPLIIRALRIAQTGDTRQITVGIPLDYAAYDTETGEVNFSHLVKGYGGIAHEAGYRKLCQMIHSRPYPQKGSVLEHMAYYLAPGMAAYNNRDDTTEAFAAAYEKLFGIDLRTKGFDAWQPAEMLSTKGVLQIVKGIKRALREAGVKLPGYL